jgi:hypothetical protein
LPTAIDDYTVTGEENAGASDLADEDDAAERRGK